MEGDIWSYGQCIDALSDFIQGLLTRPWLDSSQSQITISQGARKKIRVTSSYEHGQSVALVALGPLGLKGRSYPRRRLPTASAQGALNSVTARIRNEHGAEDKVPSGWGEAVAVQSVQIHISFDVLTQYPPFYFANVLQLLDRVQQFYRPAGNWADLWGAITYGGDEEVGYFFISVNSGNGLSPVNNGTSLGSEAPESTSIDVHQLQKFSGIERTS